MTEQIDLAMESGLHYRTTVVRRRNGLVLHRTAPGLITFGVHAAPDCRACWTVTHAASGRAIVQHVRMRRHAEQLLRALARLGDWTQDDTIVLADTALRRRAQRLLERPGGGA